MGYFDTQALKDCQHHKTKWEAVVQQIKDWQPTYAGERIDHCFLYQNPPAHHLEAKALYIFTVVRRLVCSACKLAKVDNAWNWNAVFIETSSLLFPMIELVGEARREKKKHELGAGCLWLLDPAYQPTKSECDESKDTRRLDALKTYMSPSRQGPMVSDLYCLRNYYLHGSRNAFGKRGSIADIVNAELPNAIARRAEVTIRSYWNQLKSDDGTQGWIDRLAKADIHPLPILGSDGLFDAGLIDPNIVDYLENPNATVCN